MKYYRCTRDLLHYRFNNNIYNFRMGQIVPFTEIVQNNRQNFEPFGTGEDIEKTTKRIPIKKEILIDKKDIPKQNKREPVEVFLEVDEFQVPLIDIDK